MSLCNIIIINGLLGRYGNALDFCEFLIDTRSVDLAIDITSIMWPRITFRDDIYDTDKMAQLLMEKNDPDILIRLLVTKGDLRLLQSFHFAGSINQSHFSWLHLSQAIQSENMMISAWLLRTNPYLDVHSRYGTMIENNGNHRHQTKKARLMTRSHSISHRAMQDNDIVRWLARDGKLNMLIWVLYFYPVGLRVGTELFRVACMSNQLEVANYLYCMNSCVLDSDFIVSSIPLVSAEMFEWMYQRMANIDMKWMRCMKKACIFDNLPIVVRIFEEIPSITISGDTFKTMTDRNCFKSLRWIIHNKPAISEIIPFNYVFFIGCTYEFIELVIMSKDRISFMIPHHEYITAQIGFAIACAYGRIRIVKYLLSAGLGIDYKADGFLAHRIADERNQFDILQILCKSRDPAKIRKSTKRVYHLIRTRKYRARQNANESFLKSWIKEIELN